MISDHRTQYTYSFTSSRTSNGAADDVATTSRSPKSSLAAESPHRRKKFDTEFPLSSEEILHTRSRMEEEDVDGSRVVRESEQSQRVAKVTRVETTVVTRRRRKRFIDAVAESNGNDDDNLNAIKCSTTSADNSKSSRDIEEHVKMLGLNTPENTKEVVDMIEGDEEDDEDGIEHALQASYEGLFVQKSSKKDVSEGCWRDPDLAEVIEYLSDPDDAIRVNATAYLQHLSYNNDDIKSRIRSLGGILSLVLLLRHDNPVVQRNACGVLLNLCHGQRNDANKLEVYKVGGIEALSNLIGYSAFDDIRETAAAVLWNLSSSSMIELKMTILGTECLPVLVRTIIVPYSGWHVDVNRRLNPQGIFPCSFKNATGTIRSCSAVNSEGRARLRSCQGLVPSLVHAIQSSLSSRNEVNSKSVENCICILRNLSYRIEDTNSIRRHHNPSGGTLTSADSATSRASTLTSGKVTAAAAGARRAGSIESIESPNESMCHQLMQLMPTLVALLRISTNPVSVEAIAGIFQNITSSPTTADKHSWTNRFRSEIRRAKGVHALIELLKLDKCDRVVGTAAMALRNLALDDERNTDLIADLGLKDLVVILPDPFMRPENTFSMNTIASAISTLHELVKSNELTGRNSAELGMVDRLLGMLRMPHVYSIKLLSYCAHLLTTLWKHKHLHELFRKMGYSAQDFTSHQKLLVHLINSSNMAAAAAAGGGSTSCLMNSPFVQAKNSPKNRKLNRRLPDVKDWSSTWNGGAGNHHHQQQQNWSTSTLGSSAQSTLQLRSGTLFRPHGDLCPPKSQHQPPHQQSMIGLNCCPDRAQSLMTVTGSFGANSTISHHGRQSTTIAAPGTLANSPVGTPPMVPPLYATVCKNKRRQIPETINNNNNKGGPSSTSSNEKTAVITAIEDTDSSWV